MGYSKKKGGEGSSFLELWVVVNGLSVVSGVVVNCAKTAAPCYHFFNFHIFANAY